jgi:hypothetical protein
VRAGLRGVWARERPGPHRFCHIDWGYNGEDGSRAFTDRRFCLGDPGVLRGLWVAASSIGEPYYAERALEHLRSEATKDLGGALPGAKNRFDICCGVSIIALVYLRMHWETGEKLFLDASARLFSVCAANVAKDKLDTFSYGRPGTLLALLAADSDEDPIWDGILGDSIPKLTRALTTHS